MVIERISTGIEGLDRLIVGFPKGKSILITGKPGDGKTVMALHFIKERCEKKEKTAYIGIEEIKENIFEQATAFGWNLEKYESAGYLRFYSVLQERSAESNHSFECLIDSGFVGLLNFLESDVKNVIIDNLGLLAPDMERSQFLRQINYLIYSLEKRRCTALIILDESTTQNFGECVFHPFYGIIRLFRRDNPYTDSRERAIEIVKMRGVRTPIDYILFDITNQGIKMPQ